MGFIVLVLLMSFILFIMTRLNPIFLGIISLLAMSVVDMASWFLFGVGW